MSDSTMPQYETTGELTSELVRKTYIAFCGKYRHSKTHKVLLVVIGIEILLLFVLNILNGEGGAGLWSLVVFAGAYVLLDLLMSWSVRYGAKMTVRRFEEESHTGVRGNTTAFTDTQVHLVNHGSGGSGTINLTEMKRLLLVDNVWMLVTKTAAFIPVFADQLSETDQASLLALLKQNNSKIKIQLPKKKK